MFATIIEANYISKKEDMFAAYRLTDDDKKIIQEMGKDKRIGRKVRIYLLGLCIIYIYIKKRTNENLI